MHVPRRPLALSKVSLGNRDKITAPSVHPRSSPTLPLSPFIITVVILPPLPSFHPRRPFRSGAFVWPPAAVDRYISPPPQECVMAVCDQCT